jgi:hypothetical protein
MIDLGCRWLETAKADRLDRNIGDKEDQRELPTVTCGHEKFQGLEFCQTKVSQKWRRLLGDFRN